MKLFAPIAKIDESLRLVFGYASTETLDSQGEIVRKEAIEAALPDYMRFANIREMHQPSAVGVAREAELDDKGLHLVAKIVDDEAWHKVVEGVYKGFSIGGRVTARDTDARHVITGVDLLEISLVDRPANPQAVIELFKSAEIRNPGAGSGDAPIAKAGARHSREDLTRVQRMHDVAVEHAAAHQDARRGQGQRVAPPPQEPPDKPQDGDGGQGQQCVGQPIGDRGPGNQDGDGGGHHHGGGEHRAGKEHPVRSQLDQELLVFVEELPGQGHGNDSSCASGGELGNRGLAPCGAPGMRCPGCVRLRRPA